MQGNEPAAESSRAGRGSRDAAVRPSITGHRQVGCRPPQWVGRTQELEILRAAAKSLRGGEGAAVWVEGEPGIGKSSLVAEALASASDPEWEIGWGWRISSPSGCRCR